MAAIIPGLSPRAKVLTPSSPEYQQAISRLSDTSVLPAAYVVYPGIAGDISATLDFARKHNPPLQIAVKGGGCHSSAASSSDGGVTIDLSLIKHVTVSEDKKTVAIGGGALWGDVYSELANHNLLVVGGSVWRVGVGGYLTGGGYSYLSGLYGLAIDNLVAATVVLADGTIQQCDANTEPDLFWAIRGAGYQFGVITEFVLKAYPAHGSALVGALAYHGTQIKEVLAALRTFLATQKPTECIVLTFSRVPPHFHPAILIIPYIEGSPDEVQKSLEPFKSSVQPIFEQTIMAPTYNDVSHASDGALANAPPRLIVGGTFFSEMWEDVIEHIFGEWSAYTEKPATRRTTAMWQFHVKDKIAEIATGDTAYPARKPHYYFAINARHVTPEDDTAAREWITMAAAALNRANLEKIGYRHPTSANFAVGTEPIELIYGENLPHLRKLKAKYDPEKVFNKAFVIEPDFTNDKLQH